MTRKYFYNNSLRHALPFAAASFTVGLALFACSDKDIDSNENNGKALVAFNVSETQDQAQAAAKAGLPMTRTAFANQLALQDLAPEDLTMQKLPVQGAAASSDICLIETTVPGVPSQLEATAQTRADITTLSNMGNFSTTAFYGSSDTSLEPWLYDKDTKKDGNLVAPIYWDWIKNHACFYAVYPKPDNNKIKLSPASHTGTPYVDFEVEPNVTNQKDLMTACSGNVHTDIGTMSATAPRTDLTFRHALTAVRFKVGQNLSWNKTITKVEIIGAKSKGRYTLPTDKTVTGAWNPASLSTPATFTLGGDGTVNVSTSEAVNNVIMGNSGDNFVFYMIPQSLAGVSVKIYFADATPPIAVNLTGTWMPGTTKTYALSQNTSTWNYILTVTPPSAIAYNQTTTGYYSVQSYRQDPATSTQQPVKWKIVGYDANNDGNFSMGEKPAWLTSLSKDKGDGGATAETGTATIDNSGTSMVDKLTERNNKLKNAAPRGTVTAPYDLSMHDIKGNSTPRNTANCYVISAPGTYKLPLVFGNAITGGADNQASYNSSPVWGSNILNPFFEHWGQDIVDPWICAPQSHGAASAPESTGKVVWADEGGMVTNLRVTGTDPQYYLEFDVPADKIKQGNVVVAVKKTGGGPIMWSWHLWFAPDDVLDVIECTNYHGKPYKFTKENLGWKYTKFNQTSYGSQRSVKVKVQQTVANNHTQQEATLTITQNGGYEREGYCTLYQFGRKDAFAGTNTLAEGEFKTSGNPVQIEKCIQTPETFYTYASSWATNYGQYNLWSTKNSVTGYNDNAVIKTVYDPCPAGFHIPASNAFTGFTKNGQNGGPLNASGAWNWGWNFNNKIASPDATVYFPTSGYRDPNNGSLISVGGHSYYWSAVPASAGISCDLYLGLGYVGPQYNCDRSSGGSVRPVSE